MFKSLTPVAVAAALAFAGPAAAQESQPAPEGSTADQVLDLGQPVDSGEPRIGDRYAKETHGSWDLACIKTESGDDPCSILQVLLDANGNPIAEFSLFRIEQSGGQAVAGATVIVPLETLLPAGLTISVDGAPARRYSYNFCNQLGCYAQIGLTQGDIDAFKKGNEAVLALRPAPAPDQQIDLTLSLSGFTAGYDVVDVVQQ